MILLQRYYYQQMHRLFHSNLWHFEFSIWLHIFARSMIAVFIPIFLLKMGWSLSEIMLYYFIYTIFDAPLNFVARWLIWKIGARVTIFLSTLFYIAFLVVLYNLSFGNWALLILLALFSAIYDTLYWVAHIYFFMQCEDECDSMSSRVSFFHIVKTVAGIMAPIIGAIVLIFFSNKILIALSIIVLLLSIIPLFQTGQVTDRPSKKPQSIKEFFKKGEGLREYIMQGFFSFHNVAEAVIWPIYIYIIFENFESVAIIPIIVAVTTMFFTYFTGKIKKDDRRKIIIIGSFFIALVWILRLIILNNLFYYISVALIGLFSILVALPLESSIFERGRKKDALSASTYRNLFSMTPRILFFGVLYILLEIFQISFMIAIISMFILMAISYGFVFKGPIRSFK